LHKANPLPIIGYWSLETELGRKDRQLNAWLLAGVIALIVTAVMLTNANIISGSILPVLGCLGSAITPIVRKLMNRAIRRKAQTVGQSYKIDLKLYREGGLRESDQGLMWFEGRYFRFSGKDCEFVFDAGRIRNQQHMVESIPFSYRIRETEVDGKPLYLDIQIMEAYDVELAKGELVSFDDMVRQARKCAPDPSMQEIFPPISPRPSPNFAGPAYMVGVWFGLALVCAIVSAWVWLGGHAPMPFLSGPFGVLIFSSLGIVTIRNRRRFLAATERGKEVADASFQAS